uniref:MYM-type domain-containing protein n=1 Tax=viral metagenome TaxID=1070528 RepID=A0A6C0CQZ6_9ZZZZ
MKKNTRKKIFRKSSKLASFGEEDDETVLPTPIVQEESKTENAPIFSSIPSSSFETSKIQFGKLNITVSSMNNVPDISTFFSDNSSSCSFIAKQPLVSSAIQYPVPTNNKKAEIFRPCKQLLVTTNNHDSSEIVTCWWCRLRQIPKNKACFIPSSYDDKRDVYTKYGFFCCWECTRAYNFELRDVRVSLRAYWIIGLCRRLYGIERSRKIKYAPHWTTLRRYGGTVEDDYFFSNETTSLTSTSN